MHDLIKFLRKGGEVKRFHNEITLRNQDLSQHSFGVAWLVWLLAEKKPRVELVMAALVHDLAEQITGDVPAPTKRRLQIREHLQAEEDLELDKLEINFEAKLTPEERKILKMADSLDGMLFCWREARLGNSHLQQVWANFRQYVLELDPTGWQRIVLDEVVRISFMGKD